MQRIVAVCMTISAWLLATRAQADTTFVNQETIGKNKPKLFSFYLGKKQLRFDEPDGTYLLFRSGEKAFYMVDPRQKSVMRIDADSSKQLNKAMIAYQQQIEAQMKQYAAGGAEAAGSSKIGETAVRCYGRPAEFPEIGDRSKGWPMENHSLCAEGEWGERTRGLGCAISRF